MSGQFQPGQSGNPGGRPKASKMFADALRVSLQRANKKGVEAIQRVTDKLVAEAEKGNVHAIREIADRIDGKVPQAIVGDAEHDPLIVQIVRRANDPTAP